MSDSNTSEVVEERTTESARGVETATRPGSKDSSGPPAREGERRPSRRGYPDRGSTSKSDSRSSRGWRSSGPGYQKRSRKRPGHSANAKKTRKRPKSRGRSTWQVGDDGAAPNVGSLGQYELFNNTAEMEALVAGSSSGGESLKINRFFEISLMELAEEAKAFGVEMNTAPNRIQLIDRIIQSGFDRKLPILIDGVLETGNDGYGILVYQSDNYRIRPHNAFVSRSFIRKYGLKRGHLIEGQLHPHRDGETCPFLIRINSVMETEAEKGLDHEPFEDLVPYYPLERILLETESEVPWDNLSMRVVDLLTPIGFGQRGLIVAPPRTGKTVLLQCIANSVAMNNPGAHLIVLLVDERPEEVTDFQRQVEGEVISSTFDQSAESHVHAAEMVIEKSRRMVEDGRHVVILLDSITRLARAYNALMPSSGKILSGGVEASALQKPKRFFGSARNIEGGGSLTIIGTALIDTGSRMDEVIFEEFKGTGNMELHLDRALVDKRVFPAINLEQSGTRKEELLYHPDEMNKIYSLRRAMKGVPSPEAMEMLIERVKKTPSNAAFLMGLNR